MRGGADAREPHLQADEAVGDLKPAEPTQKLLPGVDDAVFHPQSVGDHRLDQLGGQTFEARGEKQVDIGHVAADAVKLCQHGFAHAGFSRPPGSCHHQALTAGELCGRVGHKCFAVNHIVWPGYVPTGNKGT